MHSAAAATARVTHRDAHREIYTSKKSIVNHLLFTIMKKPQYQILVCNSYRVAGEAQGACNKMGAVNLLQYIAEEAADRGLDVAVSSTACLNLCSQGPIVVVQPNNEWYGKVVDTDVVDEILDALEEGVPCEKYLISE